MNDTELANDRTFLAWLRTSIALFGLGFVVSKISFIVDPDATGLPEKSLYSIIGVVLVLCGAGLVVTGYRQHAAVAAAIAVDDRPLPTWSRTITIVAVVASLVLSVLIIITT